MDALKNLLDNEKGLVAVVLLLAATVLVGLDKMPVDEWKTFSTWIFGSYAGATALHEAAQALGKGKGSDGDKQS